MDTATDERMATDAPYQGLSQVGDVAVLLALLEPDAVFVRARGGGGTSVMKRQTDGTWRFLADDLSEPGEVAA